MISFLIFRRHNSRLRERYEDDPLTHPDFDADLWMEAGLSGEPDRNKVYGLSNTTTENLQAARSVSIDIEYPVSGVCGLATTHNSSHRKI